MYIYSVVVLGLGLYLGPHIRMQSPLHNLALAWLYVLDGLVNAAYTALFAVGWFVLLAQHLGSSTPTPSTPGQGMMNDTAGFTDPEHTVSKVEIIATPKAGSVTPAQDAVAIGKGDGQTVGHAIFEDGSMMSIGLIVLFWTVRLYSCLVVMAYARGVLRQYILATQSTGLTSGSDSAELAENPFRVGREEGQGWRGKLGRILTAVPRSYWLGRDEDDEWVRGTGDKFRSQRSTLRIPRAGVGERERRARSGTGPSGPPPYRTEKPE